MRARCKICIFYHIEEREKDACLMIADSIQKLDSNAEVVVEEFYMGIYKALMYRPDVILTIPPRDANASNRLTIVKKITNCAILSLLREGYYGDFPLKRIQGSVGNNKYSPFLIDKYLFWGEKTREHFVTVLKDNGKITEENRSQTVGYVYYDIEAVKDFFKNKKLPNNILRWKKDFKKRILVLTGFLTAEATVEEVITVSGFIYYGVKGKENEYEKEVKEWRERKERFIEYRKKYLNCVCKLAEKNPDTGILVKMHPAEMEQFFSNKKFQCYRELTQYKNIILLEESVLLGRFLSDADAVVHYGSTSGLEAYIYNVPTVQLYDPLYPMQPGEPGYCNFESTVKIDVNNSDRFEKIASDKIVPYKLKSVETVLKEQFNWTNEKKERYHPVETYAKIILNSVGKGQRIEDDKICKAALSSYQGRDIKRYYIECVMEKKFHRKGKKFEIVEYQKILKELNISLLEYITIGLRIVGGKVKRWYYGRRE